MTYDDRTATPAEATAEARRLINAAYRPDAPAATFYRDTSPVPTVGTTPPVQQPGRLAMSQRAADASGLMLAAGIASVPVGGSVSLMLWTLGHVDPVVIGVVCVAPVALVAAISRALKGAKAAVAAAPPQHHHHYNAPVLQDHTSVTTETRGLIARTRNELNR